MTTAFGFGASGASPPQQAKYPWFEITRPHASGRRRRKPLRASASSTTSRRPSHEP